MLGDDCELRLAARVSRLSADAAHTAADDLVRADILARRARLGFVHPIVRAALYEDLGPGEREARHAAAADGAGGRGRPGAERVTAHLLLDRPDGGRAPGRHPQDGRRRCGAARRAARRRGAAATGARRAAGQQERAEILADLGRSEVAAGRFEAAEEHLREALASGADAGDARRRGVTLARCAMSRAGSPPRRR